MPNKLLPTTPCPPYVSESETRACCCNCRWRARDHRHCNHDRKPGEDPCICGEQRGWICMAPEFFDEAAGESVMHSNWPEHGLCEMHDWNEKKRPIEKKEPAK